MDKPSLEPLDLDGLLPSPRVGPGRQTAPLVAEFVRELAPADLAIPATVTQTPPAIKKIRDSHHSVARLLALGNKEHEVALVTGYSASRISILKADPQFKELVEFYREQATEVVTDFRERMALVGLDALQELHERLQDKPDDFSPGLLKDIIRDLADRTGHAPQRGPTSVTQVNIGLNERMAAGRERIQRMLEERKGAPIIDVG